ncbi:specifically androgen-regulated gene protein isoform X3 [Sparus aurata]|uniref:specifically androgen-regulated gene protein isoform X2 n=1 Tax=Sparus aurata TaxID=8175 RepID=UPI0011C17E52|nr:proline and serine-rich protein 2 isoform X2 [Sparus aurata]XP_030296616.1 proline and serine-rich protein 2 isoform X3 [Sparus aurata]
MDLHLQANPQLHYGINGGAARSSRPGQDDTMKFLSREEQECLQFFEETIDSLEESLEENDLRVRQVKPLAIGSGRFEEVDGPPTSSPKPGVILSSPLANPLSPKEDIIDLVQPEPDLVPTRELIFNPTSPDFQSMVPTPESHFEIKPMHDPGDTLPSEYNPPLPSGNSGPTDSLSAYHPPGSIPTPVLIAQKIAENQAGGTSNVLPSTLLRRSSLEVEKPPSYSTDLPIKQGPPTSAKPTRFPSNISLILGSKEHQNQSMANVNIQERRAQMLANLTGSHPLLQDVPQQTLEQKTRNAPTRSISFKDPSPDKSRMEALSKLGLNRNRAMSGGTSLFVTPDSTTLDLPTAQGTSAKPLEASVPQTTETSTRLPEVDVTTRHQSQVYVDRKSDILQTDSLKSKEDRNPQPPRQMQINADRKSEILRTDSLRSQEDRSPQLSPSPSTVTQNSYYPPPVEHKASISPPSEVSSVEFNSYGGKSIVVHPSHSTKSEHATSPVTNEPKDLPPALAQASEFNNYGGKSKVVTPVPVTVNRSDLPDILSSHIDKSQTLPARSEARPSEPNSYGGKTLTINPSAGFNRSSHSPAKSFKAPAPTPAPRPPRHSYHGAVSTHQHAVTPEHKSRRPGSMFRPQGITVQFSGRGAMDESRREALRKLGLLKDS